MGKSKNLFVLLTGILMLYVNIYAVEPELGKYYIVKCISNGKYVSDEGETLLCVENLTGGAFWGLETDSDGVNKYWFNPVRDTYIYCNEESVMSTQAKRDGASGVDIIAIDDESDEYLIKLVATDTYMTAADSEDSECALYGDKSYEEALLSGRFVFEELEFDCPENGLFESAKKEADEVLENLAKDPALESLAKRSNEYSLLSEFYNEDFVHVHGDSMRLKQAVDDFKELLEALRIYISAEESSQRIIVTCVFANPKYADELREYVSELPELKDNYTLTDLEAIVNTIYSYWRYIVESDSIIDCQADAIDYTSQIKNPDGKSNEGWTLSKCPDDLTDYDPIDYRCGCTSDPATLGNGESVIPYWSIGAYDRKWANDFYQYITLPSGDYRLSAYVRANPEDFLKWGLYAGEDWIELPKPEFNRNIFGNGWNNIYVDIYLKEEATIPIGVIAIPNKDIAPTAFAGFRLIKYKSPLRDRIEESFNDMYNDTAPQYFNLQGMEIEKPEHGIYIERRNGRSIKHLK